MSEKFEHILDQADDYFHDLLTTEQDKYIEEHCDRCPICKVALDEAEKRFEALQTIPGSEAPGELVESTLQKVETWQQNRKVRWRRIRRGSVIAAAACAAVLAIAHIYFLNLAPSPYDLRVFGQTQLFSGSKASLRVHVLHHDRREGLQNVPVEIALRSKDNQFIKLASFDTGAEGTGQPVFHLPDWPGGDYDLRVTARPGGTLQTITRKIALKRSWKLMLSTDRPVYQPGHEIHVRSLALQAHNLKPVAGQETVFTISDPKGNVIFKQKDVTSKFGICAADCPLAYEILEGHYTVTCTMGGTSSKRVVNVKKYVLPKFKVEVKPDREFYQPGQRVKGDINAAYFFGKPVAGGTVELELRSSEEKPKVNEKLSLKTDDKGKVKFEFPPLPKSLVGAEQNSGDARLQLRATITDTAGQKHTKTVSRIVTAQPLRITVIPEAGALVRDLPNTIYLFVSRANGKPVKARVAVSGLLKELKTSELGVTSFEFTPNKDKTEWTIRAADDNGNRSRRKVELHCGKISNDFIVRPDKAVYRGGETMHLLALGGGSEPVFIDILKGGQTILTETIPITGGRGEFKLDLPPELFGTVQLVAYRFGKHGWPVRKTRVLYVRPADQLRIHAKLDRKTYRPGRNARLQLTLTDKQGNPAHGALSLAAVDEAVFHVLDQKPGMEQTFYTLEQELLRPVYALYPWSPFDKEGAGEERDQLELALFAQTATQPFQLRQAFLRKLLPFVDNNENVFRILNRPDWEEFVQPGMFPDEIMPILRGEQLGYSISGSTRLTNATDTEALKQSALSVIPALWIGFFVIIVFVLEVYLIILAVRGSKTAGLLIITSIGVIVFSLLSPSIKVREASLRTEYQNNLKQMSLALHHANDGYKKLPPVSGWYPLSWRRGESLSGLHRIIVQDGTSNTIAFAERFHRHVPYDGAKIAGAGFIADPINPPRIRNWFPETLLWRPELITDDQGRASLDIGLADSITTWRLSASAVSADGRLGADSSKIKVFQPFFVDVNLPVALTRGDEVAMPVVLYNYLDKPQRVAVKLDDADWFERLDNGDRHIDLKPREVRSVHYRIRVRKVGVHHLQVTAFAKKGSGVFFSGSEHGQAINGKKKTPDPFFADAVRRRIEVIPDGRPVETVWNGTLRQPANLELSLPKTAVEGSGKLIVKIYPSSFSQLVEGLDSIFSMPYGCFEQTSSTTYPNVLALDYLKRMKKNVPAVEAKARHYIHLGYQRLLGFEVNGGGFDWFGRPPANRTLTAYGLMEFEDMAKVHDVDPNLIGRTRKWLLDQRKADGSWQPEGHVPAGTPSAHALGGKELARLSATAYIAWAVFRGKTPESESRATRSFLLRHRPDSIDDPHVLALVANALLAIDKEGRIADPYLNRLDVLKQTSGDGKLVWWRQPAGHRTTFYGGGQGGSVETTALSALAFMQANHNSAAVSRALTWLTQQRDSGGTWHSTQATVLALKALLAGTDAVAGEGERRIQVVLNGKSQSLTIPADQAEVMRQLNLSKLLKTGRNALSIVESSKTAAGYQVIFRHHVPGEAPKAHEPLAIGIAYSRDKLKVDDTLNAKATVVNQMKETAPMVMLDLPIPAGFTIVGDDFAQMVKEKVIAKYQIQSRQVLVYLRELKSGQRLELNYRLHATMPVQITVPRPRVYEYYNPSCQGFGRTEKLIVLP